MSQVKIGLIGGSGLGQALAAGETGTTGIQHEIDTPFGKPSSRIVETEWAGLPILFLARHGQGHVLPPSQVPYRANIFALKQLGCTHILASGAVGSLRDYYKPRELVIPDQIIDRTFRRIGTFFDRAAVHVELAEPFSPVLRRILLEAHAATEVADKTTVHDGGCYVCMEGPAFSTRAESLMHRLWGGDLIGMTAMPEAKLAREAEISYASVALVTDYDCWRQTKPKEGETPQTDPAVLLKEIIGNLQEATENGIRLMRAAVELMATRQDELMECPAQRALSLAIWSDKTWIPPEEIERLRPLWGRYFQ